MPTPKQCEVEPLTQSLVRALLDYNPETGVFVWKHRPSKYFKTLRAENLWNTRFSGKHAGCVNGKGYQSTRIFGKNHLLHRLAFLYMEGAAPPSHVDHVNGVTGDNRWCNLRKASPTENMRNASKRKDNASGVTGVNFDAQAGKWRSYIQVNSRQRFLGYFTDIIDAVEARKNAEIEIGYHQNHGRAA